MAEIKEASKIPTSCTQTESTVLQAPLQKVWDRFRVFKWETIAPGKVTSTAFESGQEGLVGSVIRVTYADDSVWRLRVTEFSERQHVIAYELLTAEPAHRASSVQGELKFEAVTTDDHTFISWTTEFSNDADLTVISDQKYKKQDFFKFARMNF